MNYNFLRKPVETDAYQMNLCNRNQENTHWPDWLRRAWHKKRYMPGSLQYKDVERPEISKLQLVGKNKCLTIQWGDWIVRNMKTKELYLLSPLEFIQLFEKKVPDNND